MKKRDIVFKIKENIRIAPKTYKIVLEGDTSAITNPGQFVNILIESKFLRRPISVGDYSNGNHGMLTLFYDVVGEGTSQIAEMKAGERLTALTGLGNGFDLSIQTLRPALIGGGIGVAPLLALARQLVSMGKKPIAFLGFNAGKDVVLENELSELGVEVIVSTADGSRGVKGFVTDSYAEYISDAEHTENGKIPDYYYACGPMPMLKALRNVMKIPGELSLDERMGCGFGACMCCSVKTVTGPKSICKDGPVFKSNELEDFN